MKKIVCYGDSNTFGYNPKDGSRFDENTRWVSLLQNNLGSGYEVIDEGMCNRTGFVENPDGVIFSGSLHLPQLMTRLDNVDIFILWIGTNDLMFQYNITFEEIENGLKNLIELVQKKAKRIILVPPVILSEKVLEGNFKDRFDAVSIRKSKDVGEIYKKIAQTNKCELFDVNEYVKPSDFDGLHYDENAHKIIADKLTALCLAH